jgi:hypothetical protein
LLTQPPDPEALLWTPPWDTLRTALCVRIDDMLAQDRRPGHPARLSQPELAGEARERGWHGETERLNYILAGIQDKLDQIERSEQRATIVQLDPPRIRPALQPQNKRTIS